MNLYADTIFAGGPVYTADPSGLAWANAVAVRDGRILAVGRDDGLSDLRGPKTRLVDLHGRLLLPGFTESHVHFIELAFRSAQIDATGARSAGEVAQMVRAQLAEFSSQGRPFAPGSWIRGGGWDANIWTDGTPPHRHILDAAAPDIPVALDSKDLHGVWLNSAALHRAGIAPDTADVPGGVIERDASGQPTGILRENAVELVSRVYPKPNLEDTMAAARAAMPLMWQTGIVAIHNANDSCDGLSFRTFQELRRRGGLGLRVLQQIPVCNLEHARAVGLRSGLGDAWLRVGGIKIFADGALGSRTAAMLQPYLDLSEDPGAGAGSWGVSTTDPEEMLDQALAASGSGLSLTIHAIGDRANRDVLNVLGEVRRWESHAYADGSVHPALRHRIEHVQCLHPDDLPRLAALDVIASVQPVHATSDMTLVDRYWGKERAAGAYAFRSLLDAGTKLVFGSDGPIEPHSPLIGIHAAVTRRRRDGTPGPEGWQGQECIAVAKAVDAYTYWPAFAAGEERYRGSIAAGKVADLVVLSENIFDIEAMRIAQTRIEKVMLDGQMVWQAG